LYILSFTINKNIIKNYDEKRAKRKLKVEDFLVRVHFCEMRRRAREKKRGKSKLSLAGFPVFIFGGETSASISSAHA
jgi:hypothetical protein